MHSNKKLYSLLKPDLKGKNGKNGFDTVRFVFNAVEKISGLDRIFYIEFNRLNPELSPSSEILGFKHRSSLSEEDIHNVLAGTASAQKLESETLVQPSYCAVKAGTLGPRAKQFCAFFPSEKIEIAKKSFEIKTEKILFNEENLKGEISVSPQELQIHPEFLCDSGTISWNLRYELKESFLQGFKGKNVTWNVPGSQAIFAGTITIDGLEYDLLPKKSFGYADYFSGTDYPSRIFHLSSSNLTSLISGKQLSESSFAVQGIYNDRLSILLKLENDTVILTADKGKRSYETVFDCSQMPGNEEGEKLHWSVSANNKKYVIDIDVFCPAKELYVRSLEKTEGKRKIMKVLTGGTATGEIRLFRKIRQNLETIEHARIAGALCEFGEIETPEQ